MDFSQMTNQELEDALHQINDEEAAFAADVAARKAAITAETEARASRERIQSLAGTLSPEDKAALAQCLAVAVHAVRKAQMKLSDTVIVLELPRRIVMWRVVKRTFGRMITRKRLWGGLRERSYEVFMIWNPDRSIIGWAWSTYASNRAHYRAAAEDPANAHLDFVFLRSRREQRHVPDIEILKQRA